MDDIKKSKHEINLRESASGQRKSASGLRESATVEWQAPAFRYYQKDVSWYWTSFIIAILVMAFAIWQKNFLFAIFIFLAEISVLILARRQPEMVKFKIDEKGITIIDKTFLFGDLEKFGLRADEENPEGKQASYGAGKNFEELIIKKKTHFNPYLKILVDAQIASQVKEILSQKLIEEAYEDSLLEVIFKWLKF